MIQLDPPAQGAHLDDTEAIQAAIDKAHADGGGVVRLPFGTYRAATLFLKSNVTLEVAKGARLEAIPDPEQYPWIDPAIPTRMDTVPWRAWIYAFNQENIALRGEGEINGRGEHPAFKVDLKGNDPRRPYGIHLVGCRNVRIEGLRLRNSAFWMLRCLSCTGVAIRDLTIWNHADTRNNDGCDIDGCRDVTISGCHIDSCDDALCLKSEGADACEHISISNCVLSSFASPLKFGTGSVGGFRNIAVSNIAIRRSRSPHWAHVLGASGYETSLIGKMHFMGMDQLHGFEDRPFGFFSAAPKGAARDRNCDRYFPHHTHQARRVSLEIAGTGTTAYQWVDDRITSESCDYLRRHVDADRPFALTVGWILPHSPYIAPRDLFEYYYERVDLPEVEEHQPASIHEARAQRDLLPGGIDPERIRVCRAAYYALCEIVDRNVGRILETLAETGLDRDTLVIYTSDHGECAGEHGLFWKGNFYDSAARVPFLARLPGVTSPGTIRNDIINLIDLGPTFAEIAGSELEWDNDGRSLWRLLHGPDPDWEQETFAEIGAASRMIRSENWKYWVQFRDGVETERALFDLASDPGESTDRHADPACCDVVRRLHERILDGFDPVFACRQARQSSRDASVLGAWGKALQPPVPYQVTLPDPEMESDFEQR